MRLKKGLFDFMRIGIDLGGTNTVVCLCDETGGLLGKDSLPTRTGDPVQMKADMKQLALGLCRVHDIPPDQVTQIGIGVPGSFEKETATLLFGTNLGMDHVCFAQAFQPEFSCPVKMDNDANCAALGEVIAGAGQGSTHAVMVTLGTGVGGGIVVGGKLYSGFNDIAGEIGHIVVQVGGLPCNCGRKGCLEAYASATGMIRLATMALEQGGESLMRDKMAANGGKLTAKMVCDARDAGDKIASQVFDDYCMYLGSGLASIVNILQPEKMIIGGGVAGYGEKLLQPLREIVAKESFKGARKSTEIVQAMLGNDAGLVGAAML
jgi:glucokinase